MSRLSLEEIQIVFRSSGFGVAKSREIRRQHKLAQESERARGVGGRDSPEYENK